VALSKELQNLAELPLPVKVLGENLSLFLDDHGCPFLYAAEKNKPAKQYPCVETAGIVFAYLGAGEAPLLPAYEFLSAEESRLQVCRVRHESSDWIDLEEAIRIYGSSDSIENSEPSIEVVRTEFGLQIYMLKTLREEMAYLSLINFILPCISAFTAPNVNGYNVIWNVPISDKSYWKYKITYSSDKPLDSVVMPNQPEPESFAEMDLSRNCEREPLGYINQAKMEVEQLLLSAIRKVVDGKNAPHVIRSAEKNRFDSLLILSKIINIPRNGSPFFPQGHTQPLKLDH